MGRNWHLPSLKDWQNLAFAYNEGLIIPTGDKITFEALVHTSDLKLALDGWQTKGGQPDERGQMGAYWTSDTISLNQATYLMLDAAGKKLIILI